MKQSFTDANNKVCSTRQSTLEDFNIDLEVMTAAGIPEKVDSSGVNSGDKSSVNRSMSGKRPSVVKTIASSYDK